MWRCHRQGEPSCTKRGDDPSLQAGETVVSVTSSTEGEDTVLACGSWTCLLGPLTEPRGPVLPVCLPICSNTGLTVYKHVTPARDLMTQPRFPHL